MHHCASSAAQYPLHVSIPMMSLHMVTSLIRSRLDYCNSVLLGLPYFLVPRLQSVQNAARVAFNLRRTAHVTDALICLNWLQVPERIRFNVAVLVYRSLQGTFTAVLSDLHSYVGDHGTLQPALGLTSPTGRSSLPYLQLGRPRFSHFGRHCQE
jgi:hypothetical protein